MSCVADKYVLVEFPDGPAIVQSQWLTVDESYAANGKTQNAPSSSEDKDEGDISRLPVKAAQPPDNMHFATVSYNIRQ